MKTKNFLLLISLGVSLSVFSQTRASIGDVSINYSLFTHGEISYEHNIFDSTLISAAHYKLVNITIVDSTTAASTKKGAYNEHLTFNFYPNGKIEKGQYTITHPKFVITNNLAYTYITAQKVLLYISMQTEANVVNNPESILASYSTNGNLMYEKSWDSFGGKSAPSMVNDTAKSKYDFSSYTYDSLGMESSAYSKTTFGDELIENSDYTFKKRSGDSLFYEIISTTSGPENSSDTIEAISLLNSSGKKTETFFKANGFTVHYTWKYNSAGQLIYYKFDAGESYQSEFEITRNDKGLPSRIIHRDHGAPITFDFEWQ